MFRKTIIDVHTHVYVPRYMNLLRSRTQVPRVFKNETGGERLLILPSEDLNASTRTGRPVGPEYYDPIQKLRFMDKHGIDSSIISLANPWLDPFEPRESEELARLVNEEIAGMCADALYEGRFYGFGVLPSSSASPDSWIREVERIAKLPRMKGAIIGTHGLGKGLDDVNLEPVFKAVAKHRLTLFVHPHYGVPTNLFGERENGHVLPLALGFPFETTIVRAFAPAASRIPDLRLLLAHSVGTLPFLAGRLDSCVKHDAHVQHRLEKPPSAYLKNLYYDAVNYHAPGLRCAIDLVGHDRIMFGTDNPFFPPLDDVDARWESVDANLRAIEEVSHGDASKFADMVGGNAERIFEL